MQSTEAGQGRCMSIQAMVTLYTLQENNQLCDATLLLDDGSEISIHRAILCAASPYFKAVFTSNLAQEGVNTRVHIPGVSSEMMHHLLKYIYLRKLDLTLENVYSILISADYLSVLGALDICCTFLTQMLTPKNVIGIMLFARSYFCVELAESCWRFIMKNFPEVAEFSEELMELSLNDLEEIINADSLNAKSEETIWNVVVKWIDYDPEQRKHHIVTLLKNIRLGLLETEFFMEKVKEHPYVTAYDANKIVIIQTLKFLYDLERILDNSGEIVTPELARPRLPHKVLFVIGGWSSGSPTSRIETYDSRADRWINVEHVDPAGPRAYHGTVVIGYKIYVIGGFDGMDYFNTCRCFDPIRKDWNEIAPMHTKRCYVSTAVLNNVIYAMGGYDGHQRQNSAEKYEYKQNQWSLIASMHFQRSDASACSLNNKIYITGGFNGQECMNSAEFYSPEVNQWTIITPMRVRRSGVSCVAHNGLVYVVGGFNGISRMASGEKFNPETSTWSSIKDMYIQRSNFAMEVIDDMIFAIGGFNGTTTICNVECYDDVTNDWLEATDMSIFRSALSACVVDGLPNVRDYTHKHRDRLMEEKRQKMLQNQQQRIHLSIQDPPDNAVATARVNIQQLHILQQLNNNNNNDDDDGIGEDAPDASVFDDGMEV